MHTSVLVGPVVFSADNLYLVRRRAQLDERIIRIIAHGSTSGAVAATIGKLTDATLAEPRPFVANGDLRDLPTGVATHPEWPVKYKSGPVITIPRLAIGPIFIRDGLCRCFVEGVRYAFNHWIFQGKKLKMFLETYKWQVKWREKEPQAWLDSIG